MINTMTKIMSVSLIMFLCWNSQGMCSEMTCKQKKALQKSHLELLKQMPSNFGKSVIIKSNNDQHCCTIGNSSSMSSSISCREGNIIFTGSKGYAVIGVSSFTQQIKVSFLENAYQNNAVINSFFGPTNIVVESQSCMSNNQQNIVTISTFGNPCVINAGGACVNVSSPLRQWFIPVAFVGIISFGYWIICRKKAI